MANSLPPRCHLDVPPTWNLTYHELYQIDPQTLPPKHPHWWYLSQDLLQIKHRGAGVLLDVGWYPDSCPTGAYHLVLIPGQDWDNPILRRTSQSLEGILSHLAAILHDEAFVQGEPEILTLSNFHQLLAQTDDEDVVIRVQMIDLLKQEHGKAAVSVLLTQLAYSCAPTRSAVIRAVQDVKELAVGEALHQQLLSPEPEPRNHRLLLRALGTVGYQAASPTLMTYLEHPDPEQQAAAAWSLGQLQVEAAEDLLTRLARREQNSRARAAMEYALLKIIYAHTEKDLTRLGLRLKAKYKT